MIDKMIYIFIFKDVAHFKFCEDGKLCPVNMVQWAELLIGYWIFGQSHFLEAALIKMDNSYFYGDILKILEDSITPYIYILQFSKYHTNIAFFFLSWFRQKMNEWMNEQKNLFIFMTALEGRHDYRHFTAEWGYREMEWFRRTKEARWGTAKFSARLSWMKGTFSCIPWIEFLK